MRPTRLLAPICAVMTAVLLAASACSVPQFEFPPDQTDGATAGKSGGGGKGGAGPGPQPTPHCENGMLDADQGESDFDCGRGCTPCGAAKHCVDAADCDPALLCHDTVCIEPGCMNQAQDGNETDVDCGGDGCKACVTGQGCGVGTDCESGVCADAKCAAAACDDQTKNGKETDIDCGGDCPPCGVDKPCVVPKDCISGECNTGVCGAQCADGFANCDKKNDNACEINVKTDADNCGFCGNVCKLPHATAECSAGECRIKTDGCEVGYQDCNGDPADGCEVDLKTNKLNCGACNKVCPNLNGTPSCVAGLCQITCDDGYKDCDDKRDNGCEVDINSSIKNCSDCGKVCPADPGYSANCKTGVCGETMCAVGKADCNADPADGCEITVANDVNNCGSCGNQCAAVNANVGCVNGKCVITSCVGNYADCGGGYADGCETNTDTSTTHCGGCNQGCTITNGTPKCMGGSCEIGTCSGTFRDCDGDPKTGCEINIATAPKNCGGCGNMGADCTTKYANASSTCVGSACTAPVCNLGYGDCANGTVDGCETNTTNSPGNCGGCGMACSTSAGAHVSSNACSNSQCAPMCSPNYQTCDNNKFNGCESDSTSDAGNCGACGSVCSTAAGAHVTSNVCLGSTCSPSCSGTYGDCDSSRTNGCETDTSNSNGNCGSCGNACSTAVAAHVTTNNCGGSACHPVCNGLYDDCNSSREDGCEKDVSADKSNCGACNVVCGTTHASAGTSCGSGKCNPTCDSGWGKCTTPEQGCVTPLGTTSNCTKCGENCASPNVFCDPGGCVDHRDIVAMTANAVGGKGGWDASQSTPAEVVLSHALQNAAGSNRMVLVGVATTDNYTNPENVSVTYSGTPMGTIPMKVSKEQEDGGLHSYAGIYYLLDSDLPTTGGTYTINVHVGPPFTWGHAAAYALELKNTMQVAPIATGGTSGDTNCGGGNNIRPATVTFTQAGSFVFGFIGARGATDLTGNTGTLLWKINQPTPDNLEAGASYADAGTDTTLSWNVTACYNSAQAIVAVKRLNWQ